MAAGHPGCVVVVVVVVVVAVVVVVVAWRNAPVAMA
jgi:hypothetical protein